jgi:hypothetical protein
MSSAILPQGAGYGVGESFPLTPHLFDAHFMSDPSPLVVGMVYFLGPPISAP